MADRAIVEAFVVPLLEEASMEKVLGIAPKHEYIIFTLIVFLAYEARCVILVALMAKCDLSQPLEHRRWLVAPSQLIVSATHLLVVLSDIGQLAVDVEGNWDQT